jgi:regulator of protease activity HflC (stomatin/prohibitin superfamily)
VVLRAQGDREAAILRAEGYALALEKVFAVARNVDPNTMGLQYLETLKVIGSAPATKLLVPVEFTALLRPFMERADGAAADVPRGGGRAAPGSQAA